MILNHFNRCSSQIFGFYPNRLVYLENLDSTYQAVESDTTRTISRRANLTKRHLEENALKNDYATAGLDGVSYSSADTDIVRAVISLQMKVFPNQRDEWDGIYGARTLRQHKEYLEGKESSDAPARSRLATLKKQIEVARKLRDELDKEDVTHSIQKDNGVYKTLSRDLKFELSDQDITRAQEQCRRGGRIEELVAKTELVKVLHFAAKAADVPPALILATAWAETYGTFSKTAFGTYNELGMGHFMPRYWKDYTHKDQFIQIMRAVTGMSEEAVKDIGRARSIVADLVAIGIKLADAKTRLGINFDYNTDVSQMDDESLMKIRFHYYAPGYAYALWRTNTHGAQYLVAAQNSYNGVKGNLKRRFADKARTAYQSLRPIT